MLSLALGGWVMCWVGFLRLLGRWPRALGDAGSSHVELSGSILEIGKGLAEIMRRALEIEENQVRITERKYLRN